MKASIDIVDDDPAIRAIDASYGTTTFRTNPLIAIVPHVAVGELRNV